MGTVYRTVIVLITVIVQFRTFRLKAGRYCCRVLETVIYGSGGVCVVSLDSVIIYATTMIITTVLVRLERLIVTGVF